MKGFKPVPSLLRPLALAAAVIALASCASPPPPPPPPGPPPAPYAAPPPPYMPAPVMRRCAPGKHYIGGHPELPRPWGRGPCVWHPHYRAAKPLRCNRRFRLDPTAPLPTTSPHTGEGA